ncbi:MAG: hypothetical protein V1824_01665 [archaeon]
MEKTFLKLNISKSKIKGQLAIEFIMLIAIFLLFFQAILLPSINFARNTVEDISNITLTASSVNKLQEVIESFNNSAGYGKVSMYLTVPSNAKIFCSNSPPAINYEIIISSQKPSIDKCNDSNCFFSKTLDISSSANLSCEIIQNGFSGKVVIEKNLTGDINVSKD